MDHLLQGANADAQCSLGITALMHAANRGEARIVRRLIRSGLLDSLHFDWEVAVFCYHHVA